MIKNILLTGGSGFLGSHILKQLLKNDYNVIVLVRRSSNLFRIENLKESFELFYLEDKFENLSDLFTNFQIDGIVHTATEYGRNSNSSLVFETNFIFPMKLIEEGIKNDLKFFINTDTFSSKTVFRDSTYLKQYNKSKFYFLEFLNELKTKIKTVNVRLEHLFGEFDSESKFVTNILHQLIADKSEIHLTDGYQKRDFIYIDDVVDVYIKVIQNLNKLDDFIEFEVGMGNSIEVREFVKILFKITQSKSRLKFGAIPTREDEIMDSKANIDNLKVIGWKPLYDLNSAFIKIIDKEKVNK